MLQHVARRVFPPESKPQSKPGPELEPKADAAETIDDDDDEDETPKISIKIGDYLPVDMKLKDEQDQDIVLGDLGSDEGRRGG